MQSQWWWGKHSGRAVVEPQFELTSVKPPRIPVFVFLRDASAPRNDVWQNTIFYGLTSRVRITRTGTIRYLVLVCSCSFWPQGADGAPEYDTWAPFSSSRSSLLDLRFPSGFASVTSSRPVYDIPVPVWYPAAGTQGWWWWFIQYPSLDRCSTRRVNGGDAKSTLKCASSIFHRGGGPYNNLISGGGRVKSTAVARSDNNSSISKNIFL